MGDTGRQPPSRTPDPEPRRGVEGTPPERRPAGERRAEQSPIGKGDTPAVAGSDQQQPEIAEGPVEGLEPGERIGRGPWHPPLEVDGPEGTAVPRDAAGEPDAILRQRREGGP